MKILKHGDHRRIYDTKTFRCGHCGCEFEANKTEYKCDTQYNEIYYYCVCPECYVNAPEVKLHTV